MDDGVEISELVYTISLLRRTQEYNPAKPSHSATKLKHLRLLDGIALLMVMGDKSDVVAVAYQQTATNLTIYYSANRPNPNRSDHIKLIADTIRNIVPNQKVTAPATRILCLCLEGCSRKIKQWVKKLSKESTDLMQWNQNEHSLETFVRSICSPGTAYQQALEFFNRLQQASNDASGPMLDDIAIIDILCRSYYIGKAPGVCATPMFAKLKRRIRKLGDYFGAARRLCAICATSDVNKYLKNLQFQEIVPPPPRKLAIRNPLIVMNSYKAEADVTITDADFRLTFPEIELSNASTMITVSQHCEISIAFGIHAGFFSPSGTLTEIGISKHSCWLCEIFLRCLESKSEQKFAVTGYQGKVHAGWHYPVEAGEAIKNLLLETLHKELGELRAMADPRRRSDSFPISSPEATAEQSDSEEVTREEILEIMASRAAEKQIALR